MHRKHLNQVGISGGCILLVCALVSGWLFGVGAWLEAQAAEPGPPESMLHAWLDLPLRFVANAGQTDAAALFTVQGAGHALFFTREGIVLSAFTTHPVRHSSRSTIRLHFVGANGHPVIEGLARLPGSAYFFLGNDPSRWQLDVPTYAAIRYRSLYPGVDLMYSGAHGQLKSEFRLAPGVDAAIVQLEYSGLDGAYLRSDGALVLQTALGDLIEAAPDAYQEINGARRVVPVDYQLRQIDRPDIRQGHQLGKAYQVSFQLGAYDPAYPLVIDPQLNYASYLGGSGDDYGRGIAVDSLGNLYVTGETTSSNFPSLNAVQGSFGGGSWDVFVTQIISASGVYTYGYSTFLGGSANDFGRGIVVDGAGNALLTGQTLSSDFPTPNAVDNSYGGNGDAFIAQIANSGGTYSLGYATYLGGNAYDDGRAIALDTGGNVWVTGETLSFSSLPTTTNAIQPVSGGGNPISRDAFVIAIVNAGGTYTYAYSSFLGGSGNDWGNGIAADGLGGVYVTGQTLSRSDFPTTSNAIQPVFGGGTHFSDAFVTRIVSDSGVYTYAYSSFLGGTSEDIGRGITADSVGNAAIVGSTRSPNFPVMRAIQPSYGSGAYDAFVTQLISVSGSYTYGYSSYLGGSNVDQAFGVRMDDQGGMYLTGETASDNFPTHRAWFNTRGGGYDAFVTHIVSTSGVYTFGYSTYLGGSGTDSGQAIALPPVIPGDVFVAGYTTGDFPTYLPTQAGYGGGVHDAFVARFGWSGLSVAKTATPGLVQPGHTITFTLSYFNDSPTTASNVVISDPLPAEVISPTYTSSGPTVTSTGSISYTWQVADLPPGAQGTINVLGVISPGLSVGSLITNTATISGTGAYTSVNPSSTAVISVAQGIYWPLGFRQ